MSTHDRLSRPGVPRPPRRGNLARSWGISRQRHLPVHEETSAGGICVRVVDGTPYMAAIARRNRAGKMEWCLPKGHLEGRETAAQAARREVAEEAGVTGRVIRLLCTIDYWFSGPRARIHKTVHHFLLEYIEGEITVENDPDQEAEDAAWFALEAAVTLLAYPNERRVVQAAIDLLYPEGRS